MANTSSVEMIVLVDEKGTPIGETEKFAAHHSNTPLHLAFSCYVFNPEGQFLVTQRAHEKKVWPGVWTNSVCGHPAPGESMPAAIQRRLDYELGMQAKDITLIVPDYRYTTPPFKGIIENEFCPIYAAIALTPPKPNPEEVAAYKWMSWDEYLKETAEDAADIWSWWCKDQKRVLVDNPAMKPFVS